MAENPDKGKRPPVLYITGAFIQRGDVVAVFDDGRLHPHRAELIGLYPPAGVAVIDIEAGETVAVGDTEDGCAVLDNGNVFGARIRSNGYTA